jgi:hypothetical protein
MRPKIDCRVVQSWTRSIGMIFSWRLKTPPWIVMRWSLSV